MNAADAELFERSVRQAAERRGEADLDAALAELGWLDALAEDAPMAVSVADAATTACAARSTEARATPRTERRPS